MSGSCKGEIGKRACRSPLGIMLHPTHHYQGVSYNLTYGIDVMLPIEVGEPTLHRDLNDLQINNECVRIELGLLNELRDKTKIREKACKQRLTRHYNAKVKLRSFRQGHLIWRMRNEARTCFADNKLTSNWEGSFRIKEDLQNKAYQLEQVNDDTILRT